MRCYSNGAQFLDEEAGKDWFKVEAAADVPPLCDGTSVLPFLLSEPSVGVESPRVEWCPTEPENRAVKVRACTARPVGMCSSCHWCSALASSIAKQLNRFNWSDCRWAKLGGQP